jgi:hypothetical protein
LSTLVDRDMPDPTRAIEPEPFAQLDVQQPTVEMTVSVFIRRFSFPEDNYWNVTFKMRVNRL